MAISTLWSMSINNGASVLNVIGDDVAREPQTLELINAPGVSCWVRLRNPAGNFTLQEIVGPGTTTRNIPSNRRWQNAVNTGWTIGIGSV